MLRILLLTILLLNSLTSAYAFGPDVVINSIKIVGKYRVEAQVDVYLTEESLESNTVQQIIKREIQFYEEEENITINKIIVNNVYLEGNKCEVNTCAERRRPSP